jgi:hypothetical protein
LDLGGFRNSSQPLNLHYYENEGVHCPRGMTRLLDIDSLLRKLCLIRIGEVGYQRSVPSGFIRRVEEDNLTRIIEQKVVVKLNGTTQKALTPC